MQLVFDRYSPRGGARHLDLATGRVVSIVVRDVPSDDWRRRWRVRVDALLDGCQGLEALVDAGESGPHKVFEVRAVSALAPAGALARRDAVAAGAIAWLGARALSTGPCRAARVLADGHLCADLQTGWPIETNAERRAASRALRAWRRRLHLAAGSPPPAVHVITGAAIDDACDARAGFVALDVDRDNALRFARRAGCVALSGAIAPAQLPAGYLAGHCFVVIEPTAPSAAAWAASLAAGGGRRHFFVPARRHPLIARERALAYTTGAFERAEPVPAATPRMASRPARRLLARARDHLARHHLAPAIRVAGRAALIAGEGTATHTAAVLIKAQALRCDGHARAAAALLQAELAGNAGAADAGLLVETAEAACDSAWLEQAEAFARAALLAAADAAGQRRARLALDRARLWRGESVESEFWQARAAWHLSGAAPRWPPRGGYPHAPCGRLAVWEHVVDRLERALWQGAKADTARLKAHVSRAMNGFPVLLRARAEWLVSAGSTLARRMGARGVLHTGKAGAVMEIFEHMSSLLSACHESSSDEATLQLAATRTRRILRARAVAVYAAGRPLPITGDGDGWNVPSTLAARCADVAHSAGPERAGDRVCAAASVRGPDGPAGALVATWPAGVPLETARVQLLLEAAALVIVPVLRDWPARMAIAGGDMPEIVGVSPAVAGVRDAIRRVARVPFAVLIEGESGAGKELVARAIHRLSPRAARPFRAINCAAMAEELVEAELFGHAQGAYTGAVSARAGLFEDADRGTLFLDEVSELSPRAQAKLLRVLQEGEVRRVGETSPRRIDVRIVAASNRPLAAAVAAQAFRADLLFRLDVLRIAVPPLRSRPEDIPVLSAHFWRDTAARAGTSALLSSEALGRLAAYSWPGNVRELQNVIASLAVSCPRRGRAGVEHLPAHIRGDRLTAPLTLHQARAALERDLVRGALARAGGRPARAAAELGLSRQGFAKLMRRLGLPAA